MFWTYLFEKSLHVVSYYVIKEYLSFQISFSLVRDFQPVPFMVFILNLLSRYAYKNVGRLFWYLDIMFGPDLF